MIWTILRWGVFVRPGDGSGYGRRSGAKRKINLLRTENRLAQNGESFSGENFVNHKSLYHSVLLMELLLGFYSKKY